MESGVLTRIHRIVSRSSVALESGSQISAAKNCFYLKLERTPSKNHS